MEEESIWIPPSVVSVSSASAENQAIALEADGSSVSNTKPDHVRKIIDFSLSCYSILEELAKGKSIGDTLRDAIALSKWFKDTREDGARIFVERNGKLREVVTIKYPPEK